MEKPMVFNYAEHIRLKAELERVKAERDALAGKIDLIENIAIGFIEDGPYGEYADTVALRHANSTIKLCGRGTDKEAN